MFSRDRPARSTAPSRPAICRRNTSAFSKRPSAILLLVEIIQFVAVNVHDKAQHIVDQSRKPCAFIPQQVEDFRHFALGLRTDINRRAVTAIYRSEEGAFEIRQRDLFTPESGRLRYGDASEGLLQVCQFLLMNPWYNVFEIEYSLYGHKARVFGFMF